jgi:hypothetical protein
MRAEKVDGGLIGARDQAADLAVDVARGLL